MEPAVLFTESVLEFLKDSLKFDDTYQSDIAAHIQNFKDQNSISFRVIRDIHSRNKLAGHKQRYLHEVLQDSDICLPCVKLPPRNPELEARIQKLKAEQDNKRYREMTRNVDKSQKNSVDKMNIGAEVKAMNSQIWSVVNFAVTVGGAFAFGYKATEIALGGSKHAMVAQMIMGLIFGTIVFFADLYFLLKEHSQY
ncbi:transmembrane protein 199-like [Mizuhopecten yessoensis]|uniref:Transmembrane protein 199 n=1 Tax=Mizuhopecten yessoensis TaxID=6573 RepID=A0A210R2F4_MIZYE|nr:transmembrane protein 199-like [Mizuhopecten yessoensis]OWF55122.1 Transmembrane protein 199 [Mizuhopecten yessoensis]